MCAAPESSRLGDPAKLKIGCILKKFSIGLAPPSFDLSRPSSVIYFEFLAEGQRRKESNKELGAKW